MILYKNLRRYTTHSKMTQNELAVLGKISAIFSYERDENGKPTGKTLDSVCPALSQTDLPRRIKATAKVDGTCCLVQNGCLHPRYDRNVHRAKNALPDGWFPTNGTEQDAGGHVIGFRTLNPKCDKWHQDALVVNTEATLAKVIRLFSKQETDYLFKVELVDINSLNGKTVELVGPKVNGNRHGIPVHALVVHGDFEVELDWSSHPALNAWIASPIGSLFEGVVIHDLLNNELFKAHRGHADAHSLPWRPWTFVE
jgi:hypothetical protein